MAGTKLNYTRVIVSRFVRERVSSIAFSYLGCTGDKNIV